jgi:hypothetical protein
MEQIKQEYGREERIEDEEESSFCILRRRNTVIPMQ